MARSHFREEQVRDDDFISPEEHLFRDLVDVPTYSGTGGDKYIKTKEDETGLEYVDGQTVASDLDHSLLGNLDFNLAGHPDFLSAGTNQTISGTKTFDGHNDLEFISEQSYRSKVRFIRANQNLLTEMYNVPWGMVGNMGTFIKDYTGEIHLDANGGAGKIFLNGTVNFPSDRKLGFGLQGSFGPFFEIFYHASDKSVHFDPKPAMFPGSEPDLIVFNETGYDTDIRMEGNTDSNLFFLDAGNERVGIGTNLLLEKFNVNGNVAVTGDIFPTTDDTYDLGSSTYNWKCLHVETIHNNPNDNLYLLASNNRQIRLYSDRDIINMLGDHTGVSYWQIENDVDGVQARIYSDGKAIFGAENPVSSEQFRFVGDIRLEGDLCYLVNTISGTGDIYCGSIYTSENSIYVNGKKVIHDESDTITISTDVGQDLVVKTSGLGTLRFESDDEVNSIAKGGMEWITPSDNPAKHINFTNQSIGGNITFIAQGLNSEIQFVADDEIELTAPTIDISGDVDVIGIITSLSYYGDGSNLTGIATKFTELTDTSTTYSGSAGKYIRVKSDTSGLEFVDYISSYPKYYISEGINIKVGEYEQYLIHVRDYLEIDGSIEFATGAELIFD